MRKLLERPVRHPVACKFVSRGDKSGDRIGMPFGRFTRHEIGARDRLCSEKIEQPGRAFSDAAPRGKIRRTVRLQINRDADFANRSSRRQERTLLRVQLTPSRFSGDIRPGCGINPEKARAVEVPCKRGRLDEMRGNLHPFIA